MRRWGRRLAAQNKVNRGKAEQLLANLPLIAPDFVGNKYRAIEYLKDTRRGVT